MLEAVIYVGLVLICIGQAVFSHFERESAAAERSRLIAAALATTPQAAAAAVQHTPTEPAPHRELRPIPEGL